MWRQPGLGSANPDPYTLIHTRRHLQRLPVWQPPPATNPQNLRTLTPQLEVRTPTAKAIWGINSLRIDKVITQRLTIVYNLWPNFQKASTPGKSVLSLRCQKPRNKCQCQCPILLLPSSLCHSASWAHCSGHSSITLCHVDWRIAVHLLTMSNVAAAATKFCWL